MIRINCSESLPAEPGFTDCNALRFQEVSESGCVGGFEGNGEKEIGLARAFRAARREYRNCLALWCQETFFGIEVTSSVARSSIAHLCFRGREGESVAIKFLRWSESGRCQSDPRNAKNAWARWPFGSRVGLIEKSRKEEGGQTKNSASSKEKADPSFRSG